MSGPTNVPGFIPPARIETDRLILRAWTREDTTTLKATIDRNIDHLTPWIPWAPQHPKSLDQLFVDVERFVSDFENNVTWLYGIFVKGDATPRGGIGIHPRIGPGGVEIGYWLDREATGRGYVTEATEALVDLALSHHAVLFVEIRCDPRNLPSAAIPQRLGFQHQYTIHAVSGTDPTNTMGELMVWRTSRFARSSGSTA